MISNSDFLAQFREVYEKSKDQKIAEKLWSNIEKQHDFSKIESKPEIVFPDEDFVADIVNSKCFNLHSGMLIEAALQEYKQRIIDLNTK